MSKINQNVEFRNLKKDLECAGDTPAKIKILEKLVRMNPSYFVLSMQKKTLRSQLEALRANVRGSHKQQSFESLYEIKRGKYQACFIGAANSGKSTLFNRLTGAEASISPIPFTTYKPEVGSMNYRDVNIQLVEIPAIYEGDSDRDTRKYRFINQTDLGVLIINSPGELDTLLLELWNQDIHIGEPSNLPGLIVYRADAPDSALKKTPFEGEVSKAIYESLGITRVYVDKPSWQYPLTFTKEIVTVEDVRSVLEKKNRFGFKMQEVQPEDMSKVARLVSLDHVLNDGDRIRFQ